LATQKHRSKLKKRKAAVAELKRLGRRLQNKRPGLSLTALFRLKSGTKGLDWLERIVLCS
jgi:hypothetical protein